MTDCRFLASCLHDIRQIATRCAPREMALLHDAVHEVATDPGLPGRRRFVDPALPSFLYAAGPFLLHYRLREDEVVEFLNIFFQY